MDAETRRAIRQEVERAMNILLTGTTRAADKDTEGIEDLFPGMPGLEARPLVLPYGYATRAPDKTLNFSARVGAHPGSRYVIGHRASDRPALASGEAAVYSFGGFLLRVFGDKIQVGKRSGDSYTFETVVAGETLVELLVSLLDAIAAHTHPSIGSPPSNAPTFTTLKSNYAENGKILVKDGGRF